MNKHRIEALTDGIFGVALTLLVIELKVPDASAIRTAAQLDAALGGMTAKFIGFLVLALFWHGHHRAFQYVKRVSGRLIALNLVLLAFVSLMPFASGLAGEHTRALSAQMVYSFVMACVAASALILYRHLYLHPELCDPPMPEGVYRGARFRTFMLMVISATAVVIALKLPGAGNMAFALMLVVGPVARRIEAKYAPSDTTPIPASPHP
jgi:uncharacterized membrane protein